MPAEPERPAPRHTETLPAAAEPVPWKHKEQAPRIDISISDILPPRLLEEYENVSPGLKQEFITHWREDRKLAQEAERAKIKAQNRASFSLFFSTITITITVSLLALGIFVVAAYLTYIDRFADAVKLLGGAAGLSILGNYLADKTKK